MTSQVRFQYCPAFSATLTSALLKAFTSPRVLGIPGDRAMSMPSQPQEISVLSTAKRGLTFLTANDWSLIADKAVKKQFKTGEAIIRKGQATQGIHILTRGSASVEINSRKTRVSIGPGEVCGEISFLDELAATVSVTAEEPVTAYFLDRPTLQKLFELFPHLGSRFYHSLAIGLARRLRELINSDAAGAP
jgi:CRP/FNR family cyclic AMP-dependent transcriptional regulator